MLSVQTSVFTLLLLVIGTDVSCEELTAVKKGDRRTEFICCLCVFKNSKDMLLYLFLLLSHILGLTTGDSIYTYRDQLSGNEGESVTMKCNYQTDYSYPELYWYKHDSDIQTPQFILWKGAKSQKREYILDKRYESRTTPTSTELIITKLTLADTALYYCALVTQ
ncbi:hypothetical protein OJAV_G00169740 [Oryzias javanicus]|uniref:Ig-like domain-containing protein n=1 Tax=Oryzias javanicus TaxID=123683 RepID=A0A3S2M745_ORYJA|nr:hypothetical protein OJAV_G00169740 [Oryzias javanicus]